MTLGVADPTAPPDRFVVVSGVPFFETSETRTLIRHRLTEVEAGRFIAENGQTLDLTGPVPTWRSIRLVRVSGGPAPWQWVMLAIVALIAAGWLVSAVAGSVRRRTRVSSANVVEPAARHRWRLLASVVAALAAIVMLATIGLVAAVPGLVDIGFLGWLEFPMALRLALHLPLALASLAGLLLMLGVVGWMRYGSPRAISGRHAALAMGLAAFVGQLFLWDLIGWGLT